MGAKLLAQLSAVHSVQSKKNLKLGNWSVTLLLVGDLLSSFERVLQKNTDHSAHEVSYNGSFIWKFGDW